MSRDLQIFVDEVTEPVAALVVGWWCCGWGSGGLFGWSLPEGSVWAVGVVVVDVPA
jgi:hypothetical protein